MIKGFFDFFTAWLWIPTIFSLFLTIYQHFHGLNTIWTLAYAWMITIWATLMTERWKRKEHQIAFLWGYNLSTIHTEKSTKLNPHFVGYKRFDISTHELVPDKEKGHGRIAKTINLLISMILISANVFCYFHIKEDLVCYIEDFQYFKDHGKRLSLEAFAKSMLISMSTGFFNVIYK